MLGILPRDPYEYCQLFCDSCKRAYSFKEKSSLSTCKCGDPNLYPIWKVVFFVKDESTLGDDRVHKLHLYTMNPLQSTYEFFGFKPSNLYKSGQGHESPISKLYRCIKLIMTYNVHLDLIIRHTYSKRQVELEEVGQLLLQEVLT